MILYGLDTEGTGLDFYHGDRVFCWSIAKKGAEPVYIPKTQRSLKKLFALFNNTSNILVFHNAKHDLKALHFDGLDLDHIKARVDCTMVMSKVLDSCAQYHNIRVVSRRYLYRDYYFKEDAEDWIKSHTKQFLKEQGRLPNFADVPRDIIVERCKWDARTARDLYLALWPKIQRICPELYETERQLIFTCLRMELRGVPVDITRAKELRTECLKNLHIIQAKLNKLTLPLIIEKKKGLEKITKVFNPGSSLQMVTAFKKLGIDLIYKTKPKKDKKSRTKKGGGRWSFDEFSLVRYVAAPLAEIVHQSGLESWPFDKYYRAVGNTLKKHRLPSSQWLPPLVIKHREYSKLITTYYDHIINDSIDRWRFSGREYGILHCNFNQSTAATGRFSSTDPNLQNMPRLLGPRECFVPRRGTYFWHFDYKQVEMRFYIHFAKDDKMLARLPYDLHLQTASDIYSKPPESITKEERDRAATVNFAIIYGAGDFTLSETLTKKGSPTTVEEAGSLKRRYFRTYPLVPLTIKRLARELEERGYVTNPYGRRYYIPAELGYKVLNYYCQGTSADQIKLAMVNIDNWLRCRGFRARLLMQIHDELVIEIPRSEVPRVIPWVVKLMEDHTKFYVPILVGIEVAKQRWSEKEKVKDIKTFH